MILLINIALENYQFIVFHAICIHHASFFIQIIQFHWIIGTQAGVVYIVCRLPLVALDVAQSVGRSFGELVRAILKVGADDLLWGGVELLSAPLCFHQLQKMSRYYLLICQSLFNIITR